MNTRPTGMKTPFPEIQVYTAILNQTGETAPVATILHNSMVSEAGNPATPLWARTDTGDYYVSLQDLSQQDSTYTLWAMVNQSGSEIVNGKLWIIEPAVITPDRRLRLWTTSGLDDVMTNLYIEIRYYKLN